MQNVTEFSKGWRKEFHDWSIFAELIFFSCGMTTRLHWWQQKQHDALVVNSCHGFHFMCHVVYRFLCGSTLSACYNSQPQKRHGSTRPQAGDDVFTYQMRSCSEPQNLLSLLSLVALAPSISRIIFP